MPRSVTRRGLVAALLAGGTATGVLSPANGFLEGIAPLSGDAYHQSDESIPTPIESPYGSATITYDDHHVPHVEADTRPAAFFAVGYAQAADRLFQMDMFRRRANGTLAEVGGDPFVEQDVFHTRMDFRGAAEASRAAIQGTESERMTAAYADGVNAYVETGSPGMEFDLLDYDPDPWRVVDTLLVGMVLNEQQTLGAFPALHRLALREAFDRERYQSLYPTHFDHGAPVVRDSGGDGSTRVASRSVSRDRPSVDVEFLDWLTRFGGADLFGSNAWVVSGEYTASGSPIVCNDPHLPLTAPPIFYQQHVTADGLDVRGVTFPGVPFVFVGETDHTAWGITSAPVDLVDIYTYDIDGEQYRYRDGWRAFETETRTVEVRFGENREVEVQKTVHGPFVEQETNGETHRVGVAWMPLTGTRTLEAIYGWNTAEGIEEFRAATQRFDTPPLHVHYADRTDDTLYQLAASVPIRRVDGDIVRGDQVFDGSAGEAEWDGYEPYGEATFEGFVPFEELPAAINPDYVASANQRPADDPAYPLGTESKYGFRGKWIYERLDQAAADGTAMDWEFMRSLQLDTVDIRARELVPAILDARDRMPEWIDPWLDELVDWEYRMDRDSKAALVFDQFMIAFEEETWRDDFEERGLPRRYWPAQWVLVTLSPDSEFFDGDRAGVLATAMERAVERIQAEGWEVYGDVNRARIVHPLGHLVSGLNYPAIPIDGSRATVNAWYGFSGVSYRLISDLDGASRHVLPGGNDGSVYSEHYHDQLSLWADGEYTRLDVVPSGTPDISLPEGQNAN